MLYGSMPGEWPEYYGFNIYSSGDCGPCYVVRVDRDSIAYKSGLLLGDQILEIDDRDVSGLSHRQVITRAKQSISQPPTLSVVCCAQKVAVVWSERYKYGFTTRKSERFVVKHVERCGPACQSGLRAGDIILERKKVPCSDGTHSTLLLNVVPVGRGSILASSPYDESWRAKQLYVKMKELMGDDFKQNMSLVSAMKSYAENRNVETLCDSLSAVLTSHQTHQLIPHIRHFIPADHLVAFDKIMKQTTNGRQSDDSGNFSARDTSQTSQPQRKAIQVYRNEGQFGFVLRGGSPVYIETVDQDGPAHKAGLHALDLLVKINEVNVSQASHNEVIQLLQDSGPAPVLGVVRNPSHDRIAGGTPPTATLPNPTAHTERVLGQSPRFQPDWNGSKMRRHLDELLTSAERVYLKQCLQYYSDTGDIDSFIPNVSQILDSPSKQILWLYIVPCLNGRHQLVAQQQMDTLRRTRSTANMGPGYATYPTETYIGYTDNDDCSTDSLSDDGSGSNHSTDSSSNATKQSKHSRDYYRNSAVYDDMSSTVSSEFTSPDTRPSRHRLYKKNRRRSGRFITPHHTPTHARLQKTRSCNSLHSAHPRDWTGQSASPRRRNSLDDAVMSELHEAHRAIEEAREVMRGRRRKADEPKARYVTVIPVGHYSHENKAQLTGEATTSTVNHETTGDNSASISDTDSEPDYVSSQGHRLTVYSPDVREKASIKPHNEKDPKSLRPNVRKQTLHFARATDDRTDFTSPSTAANHKTNAPVFTAPFPPPLPAAGVVVKDYGEDLTPSMNVKRINWEKLNIENTEGTVWSMMPVNVMDRFTTPNKCHKRKRNLDDGDIEGILDLVLTPPKRHDARTEYRSASNKENVTSAKSLSRGTPGHITNKYVVKKNNVEIHKTGRKSRVTSVKQGVGQRAVSKSRPRSKLVRNADKNVLYTLCYKPVSVTSGKRTLQLKVNRSPSGRATGGTFTSSRSPRKVNRSPCRVNGELMKSLPDTKSSEIKLVQHDSVTPKSAGNISIVSTVAQAGAVASGDSEACMSSPMTRSAPKTSKSASKSLSMVFAELAEEEKDSLSWEGSSPSSNNQSRKFFKSKTLVDTSGAAPKKKCWSPLFSATPSKVSTGLACDLDPMLKRLEDELICGIDGNDSCDGDSMVAQPPTPPNLLGACIGTSTALTAGPGMRDRDDVTSTPRKSPRKQPSYQKPSVNTMASAETVGKASEDFNVALQTSSPRQTKRIYHNLALESRSSPRRSPKLPENPMCFSRTVGVMGEKDRVTPCKQVTQRQSPWKTEITVEDSGTSHDGDASTGTMLRRSTRKQAVETTEKVKKYYDIFNKSPLSVSPSLLFDKSPKKSATTKSPRNSPALSESSGRKEQLIIDAGQKELGASQCTGCGMLYTPDDPADSATHTRFHKDLLNTIKFMGWKSERVVREYIAEEGRVLLVGPDSPGYAIKKVMDINKIMAQELGFSDGHLSSKPDYKVFLYACNKQIVACCVAEPVAEGYRVIPASSSQPADRAWTCDTVPQPASVGIGRIWVYCKKRRQGIAGRLLDCVRHNFAYGSVIKKSNMAFSDPTPDGMKLASHYTGTHDFLVYVPHYN